MGAFEKRLEKFMRRPAPKDITLNEIAYLAERLGFEIEPGGKHPLKIVNPETKEVFPVPEKNGIVRSYYVSQLQDWFKDKLAKEDT